MFFFIYCWFIVNFFTNPIVIENARLKLALIIPTGTPVAVANDAIEVLPVATDETINDLPK